jgi:hypothetical protein
MGIAGQDLAVEVELLIYVRELKVDLWEYPMSFGYYQGL